MGVGFGYTPTPLRGVFWSAGNDFREVAVQRGLGNAGLGLDLTEAPALFLEQSRVLGAGQAVTDLALTLGAARERAGR